MKPLLIHHRFKKWVDAKHLIWLDKRIPPSDKVCLGHNSIFIFLSRFGFMFTFLTLVLFLLGTNYQNNIILLISYFFIAILLVSLLQCYFQFSSLTFSFHSIEPIFANQSPQYKISVYAAKSKAIESPLFISLFAQKKNKRFAIDHTSGNFIINGMNCSRGIHLAERVTIVSYFPFGLFRCWTHLKSAQSIIVYPKPIEVPLDIIEKGRTTDGKQQILSTQHGDDLNGVRAYRKGDPIHTISWKHMAKGQGVISKDFTSVKTSQTWLHLSSDTNNEDALSKLCFQIVQLSKANIMFGVEANDRTILPNNGSVHLHNCLRLLASLPHDSVAQYRTDHSF